MENQESEPVEAGAKSFTPITSQEAFDKAVGERLARERGKFADYEDLKAKAVKLEELENKGKSELEKLQEKLAKAEAKVSELELANQVSQWKEQVAAELNIPARALAGSTLEEIQAHGATLAELFACKDAEPPKSVITAEKEPTLALNGDGIEDALKRALGIS